MLTLGTNLYDEYRAALALLREYVHDHSLEGDVYFEGQLWRCLKIKEQLLALEAADLAAKTVGKFHNTSGGSGVPIDTGAAHAKL